MRCRLSACFLIALLITGCDRSSAPETATTSTAENKPALPMPTFAEKRVFVEPNADKGSPGKDSMGQSGSNSALAPATLSDSGTAPVAPAAPSENGKKDQEKPMPLPLDKPAEESTEKPVAGDQEKPTVAPLPPSTPESPAGNRGDAANPAPLAVEPPKPELSVSSAGGGEPVLSVKFPWKQCAQPSLQLAVVTDPKVDPTKLQPMLIDGPAAVALWQTMVGALNKPLHAGTTEVLKTRMDFMAYDAGKTLCVRARTNSLDQPAAFGVDAKDGASTVFYLLDSWTEKNGDLRISQADLIDVPQFAEKGQLRVSFLDAEKVLWAVTVDWPGKIAPKPAAEQPVPAAPPGTGEKPPESLVAPTSPTTEPAGAKPAQPPAAAEQKPAEAEQKPAVVEQKPAAVEQKPAGESQPPQVNPAKTDIREMSVDELARHIEKTWGPTMNPRVRKQWVGGWANYYQVDNPESVRRDVFMQLIKLCYNDQDSGDLRNAFAMLYQKLKQQRPPQ